jgi:hypothetical protein
MSEQKRMTYAIIRGKNGRRHEVDFGDSPVRVQVYAPRGKKKSLRCSKRRCSITPTPLRCATAHRRRRNRANVAISHELLNGAHAAPLSRSGALRRSGNLREMTCESPPFHNFLEDHR